MKLNQSGKYIIGVDIGGTNVRAAVTDRAGKAFGESRNKTLADDGPKAVLAQIVKTVQEAMASGEVTAEQITGVGCGMPGRTNREGVVTWSPNFVDIEGFELVGGLSKALNMAVLVENDVNTAAVGEFRFGAGQGVDSLVMLTLGTGIGGGIILNRQLWRGANAGAAEIGHMVVNPGGRKCECGNHGCLEAMAQRDAIVERAARKMQAGMPSSLAEEADYQVDKITPEIISRHAASGDELCLETLAETGHWVGIGIANCINLLNPDMVIVGGGIAQAGPPLWEPLKRGVRAYAIQESRVVCQVVESKLGDDAGIMGGVVLVLQALERA
ncbi:MAG: ROK family protein [Armatimonadetes bacterium]|nr:ROK family protein [Armatimonadota bacterium]